MMWYTHITETMPNINVLYTLKNKVRPYSLPNIGPEANPTVQAVSQQVTKPSTRW